MSVVIALLLLFSSYASAGSCMSIGDSDLRARCNAMKR